jgi:hypothetical protein
MVIITFHISKKRTSHKYFHRDTLLCLLLPVGLSSNKSTSSKEDSVVVSIILLALLLALAHSGV